MSAAQLELAASILGPVVEDVVFVGGATIHIWLSEEAAPPARATVDVDVICDVQTLGAYYELADRLRERELTEVMNESVICRWRHRGTGLAIDVMPATPDVLGFSNPWYALGIQTAVEHRLGSGVVIRAIAPPVVVATKLSAWAGRGRGDVLRSHDLHDILVLVNGRPELANELAEQREELREYAAAGLTALLDLPYFDYAIQDAVRGYGAVAAERAAIVKDRILALIAV